MKNMNGSIKHKNGKDVSALLQKRRRILEDILKSQDAYWIMQENDNYQQISDMFEQVNKSLKTLEDLDSGLKNVGAALDLRGQEEIKLHKELLGKIMQNDRKIHDSLQGKKDKITAELKNVSREQVLNKSYSQNIPREGLNKFSKEI
jgi:hypothetical protein